MKKFILSIVIGLIALFKLQAQTGSFNKQIDFNGEARQVSFFVPLNFDSTKQYSLIVCLHGLGDNSSNYRNAIINTLTWGTIFTNTIFAFPDGGSDYYSDFFSPAGDEAFIDEVLSYCKKNYKIKPDDVILQGFSLGGRSALKLGLDHPEKFKALLLNTPALQGIKDFENFSGPSLVYNYANSKNIPVFISVGIQDVNYIDIVDQLAIKLKENNAPIYYQRINNMSHTIAVNAQIRKCLAFFESKFTSSNDLDLFKVESPLNVCGKSLVANCFVRNNGSSPVSSVKLEVRIGAESFVKNANVSIQPNEHVVIPFEITTSQSSESGFFVSIQNTDLDSTNNTKLQRVSLSPIAVDGVFTDGFEALTNWVIQMHGNPYEWYLDPIAKKSGSKSLAGYGTIFDFDTYNYTETVTSRAFDLTKMDKKTMSFDVAFNYVKYTAPYFDSDTVFADTLEIQVSNDCGASYETVYKKGGKELATTTNPVLNPLNHSEMSFVPNENEWRREVVDISKYATSKNLIVRLNLISGMGGLLNIDNFSLGEDVMGVSNQNLQEVPVHVYPNPANESVNFDIENVSLIRVLDMEGKVVSEEIPEQGIQVFYTAHLVNGLYIVQFYSKDKIGTKRVLIQH